MAAVQDPNKELEAKKALLTLQGMILKATDNTTDAILRGNRAHAKSAAILKTIDSINRKTEKTRDKIRKSVEDEQHRTSKVLTDLESKIKVQKDDLILQKTTLRVMQRVGATDKKIAVAKSNIRSSEQKIVKLEEAHNRRNAAFKKFIIFQKDQLKKEIKGNRILSDVQQKYEATDVYFIKNAEEYNDALEHRLKLQEECVDALQKAGKITEAQAKNRKKEIRGESNVAETRAGLRGKATPREDAQERYREYVKENAPRFKVDSRGKPRISGKFISKEEATRQKGEALEFGKKEKFAVGKDLAGSVQSFASAKGFKGRLEAAKGIQDSLGKLKTLNATLGETAGLAKGAAGMFQGLGSAMGMLGKIGWIGLILSAVQMIASAVNDLNKFVKQYNKSFVKMYGPTVALKDVSGSMKAFSDAVFDMNRNLKYGLKSEDIMGLFEAMSAGGLSLQGVGKRIGGGYNEVILEATKLSKDFGVDLSEMGGMISDQMIDLRASLKDVSDSMEAMAYDASIAGIKSQKFYEAVSAATSALGYYGNYLNSTSAMLRTFADKGAMPFKDAAKEAQDLMGVFSGMDTQKKMGFIQMVGDKKVRSDMIDRAAQISKEEDVLTERIAAAKESARITKDADVKEKKLREAGALEEEKAAKRRVRINLEAYAKGDTQALATGLNYMTDKTVDYLISNLKNAGVSDLFDTDNLLAKAKILATTAQMPEEALTKLLETGRVVLADAKKSAEFIGDKFDKLPKDSRAALKGIMSGVMDSVATGEVIDEDALRSNLTDFVKSGSKLGMSVEDFIGQFKSNAYLLDKAVSGLDMSNEQNRKDVSELFMKTGVSMKSGAQDQANRLDEIVKNTTSFEDFLGIGKENMKYMAAMAGGGKLQDMANSAAMVTAQKVGGILGLLQKWMTGKKDSYVQDDSFKAKGGSFDQIANATMKTVLLQKKLFDLETKYDKNPSPVMKSQMEQIKGQISSLDSIKDGLSKDRPDLATEAVIAGGEAAQGMFSEQTKLSNRKSELESSISEGSLSGSDLLSAKEELAETEEVLKKIAYAINNPTGSSQPTYTPSSNIPTAKDAQITKSGLLYGTEGDILANKSDGAKMITAGMGQFANRLLSGGGGQAGTVVSLSLSIGNINGVVNTESFLKEAGPALQQLVAREYNDRQKRS